MSAKMQQQIIEWRRAKVMELLSKGESNQSEIDRILQVDKSIISRDVTYLREQAKHNIKKYIDEWLPASNLAAGFYENKVLRFYPFQK